MGKVKWLKSKKVIFVLSYFSILIIGILDYITSSYFSFSIFYIIPIALFALYRKSSAFNVILLSVLSTLFWSYADFNGREYEHIFFPIWNSLVRLFIFILIGLILIKYKESNKRLKDINIKLQQVNEEKNKIIGIAAHDLRTPLAMINNFTAFLLNDIQLNQNPVVHKKLMSLNNISLTSLNLINNLLDISKIESGKIELNYDHSDYIVFISELLEYNNLVAQNKNIVISFESENGSLAAKFDKLYITQVLNNLISNAIKFSERGSKIIVKVSLKQNSTILTEVIDYGKGIKNEEQQLLFNYFQKTSTLSTEGEQNTGLGLAIVKKVVQAHKGEVGVRSEPEKGSTFYFTLPLF